MAEKHPPYPNDDHLWSDWQPFDKMHVYRVCIHPDCKHVEKRKVI